MFLNMDQLEKQLDKDEFQEIGSMAAFRVLETQCQNFIKSQISLDDEDGIITRKYFLQYTQLEVQQFHDTLIQHMESVKKSIDKRALHKREYDRRDTSSKSGNDIDTDDIRPIYDEEPMAEVQLTAECNVFSTGQDHSEQPEFNNEGEVDQNAKQCHDILPLPAKLIDNKTTKLSNQYLDSKNICLKKTVAQFQKDFSKLEAHCINLELQLPKFAKPSISGKPVLQSLRNQSVVRQPTTFKFERPRISKPRFASQVDVNNVLSKPVIAHYLLKERESVFAKSHHIIASSESRNSSKNMPRFSSNDMVHNHYLDEAKKKTQERGRNSRPSMMPSARSQSTANDSKPKPRINNQKSRNWPASKTSYVTKKTAHSRTLSEF
ncbi:hypothetical protein Tco_0792649 [Tanacetum coccineum]